MPAHGRAINSAKLDIFDYSDFRAYLRDHYSRRKAEDSRFSHRFIMDKVGASQPSWFNDLVKGRISLTGAFLVRLGKLLRLRPKEMDYFETLVRYQQAEGLDERNRCMEKLISFQDLKMDVLGREKFEFYAHWYHSTLRELLFFHDFDGDHAKLARQLRPAIRKEQSVRALELLEKLDLIRKQAGGHYRPTSANVIKDSCFKSEYIANFIRANIELAMDAFERIAPEERVLSTVTISLSPKGFEGVKAELKGLRRRFLEIAERDASPTTVYQCSLHVFPTTR